MAKTKNITITVYEIQSTEISIHNPDLCKDLHNVLNNTESIRERLMPLSKESENIDSDFIANFTLSNDFLFGCFARLKEGEESVVQKAVLDKKTVSLNEMISESKQNTEGSINKSCFFCIHNNLLALSDSQTMKKAFTTYINWIFEQKNMKLHYNFVPKKNTTTTISISEIKSIQLSEGFYNLPNDNSFTETKSKMININKDEIMKMFLTDVKDMKDFADEELISATLTLKFNQRKIKKEKALDTVLNIVDSDDVVITGKNGKKIKGSEYLIKAKRKIESTSHGLFNEPQIETEMKTILKKVENNEIIS